MSRPWKIEWRYLQHSGKFTRWRFWGAYKTKENAEKAARLHQGRWRLPVEFRVIEPKDRP